MYLTEHQLELQKNALKSLAKAYSAETNFALLTDNQKVITAYWAMIEPKNKIEFNKQKFEL